MSHKKYREEKNCLNCGAEVDGKFCPNCGQENLDTHENFFHVAGHFISDVFHYDSKFFSSLFPLFAKPGFLTKEYWEGRRVRYIHPLRLFFFASVLFVLASSIFFDKFSDKLKEAFTVNAPPEIARIDDAYLATLADTTKIYVGGEFDSLTVKEIKNEKTRPARIVGKLKVGTDTVLKSVKYVTFLLIPVYALLFKILYRRRKSFYVDHLVYVLHLQSFMYVVLSVLFLLPSVLPLSLGFVRQSAFLVLLVYLGFSLHYLYHQPVWKTVVKSALAAFSLYFITVVTVLSIAAIDAIFILP